MSEKNFYFLGIGGIGTSSLACYYKERGYGVAGHDRVASPLTKKLAEKGILIQGNIAPEELPQFVSPNSTTVVVSAAIKKDQPLYDYFVSQGYRIEKRAQTLARIANEKKCIAVAGTHGKTSTLSYLTHIFVTAKYSFSAFVGGLLHGYETNYISMGEEYILVEADEYDRSFLELHPDHAAITNIDPDHLDVYGSREAFHAAFGQFASQVKNPLVCGPKVALEGKRIGNNTSAHYRFQNARPEKAGYRVDIDLNGAICRHQYVAALGQHNLRNAITAAALAHQIGLPIPAITKGLETFMGIHRRMSLRSLRHDLLLIDDYAHHPTEIRAVFDCLKERYSGAHKTVIFQPHLYSRTRDFLEGFARELSLFDRIYILPIYPAREAPIDGINSEALLKAIPHTDKYLIPADKVPDYVESIPSGVVALLGAGDIGRIPEQLKTTPV